MQNSKLKWLMNTSEIWSINYISISMLLLRHIIRDITTQKVFQLIDSPMIIMIIQSTICIMMIITVIQNIICIMVIHTMHLRVITFITMNMIHGMQVTLI